MKLLEGERCPTFMNGQGRRLCTLSAYIFKGRAYCGKEARERKKVLSRVSCSNLLKVGTHALILSMVCTDVQIVDD